MLLLRRLSLWGLTLSVALIPACGIVSDDSDSSKDPAGSSDGGAQGSGGAQITGIVLPESCSEDRDCRDSEYCDESSYCADQICTPWEGTCDGDNLIICDESGGDYYIDGCEHGCQGGAFAECSMDGWDPACFVTGSARCDEDTLFVCEYDDDDLQEWFEVSEIETKCEFGCVESPEPHCAEGMGGFGGFGGTQG